jgi:heme exporter protein D
MDLGPHAAFIVLSYVAAIVVLAVLAAWVVIDHRALKRTLSALEAQGVTRRSEQGRSGS